MIKDFFKLALTSIQHRQLRSWLTILGIVIGVAAIISLISLGQGMQTAITSQLGTLGTDKLIITPGSDFMSMGGLSTAKLTDHDIDIIQKVRGVEHSVGMIYKVAKVSFSTETKQVFVIGMPVEEDSLWFIKIYDIDGRYPQEGDKYKAVVGNLYSQGKVFKKEVKNGNWLDVENESFKVVGVLEEIGNRQDDGQIYIPIETAREIFNEPDALNMIYVKVRTGFNPSTVAKEIERDLRNDRNEDEGEESFSVQTAEQLVSAMKNILGIIQAILVGIAAIALLVGGIGIMNIMYASVLERTREIGVMKAIGAKNSNILLLFIIESGFLGLVGGCFGILIGFGLAKGAQFYAAYAGYAMIKAAVTPQLISLGLGFSFIIGTLSGLMPARKASKLKPADALRYE